MAQATTTPHAPQGEAPPPFAVLELLNGLWVARAVQLAAELGVSDLLGSGPRPIEELAHATGADADALGRLLRALSTVGIFSETTPGTYTQTPRSACLASEHPASMRSAALMFGARWQWDAWGSARHSIATGEPSFDRAHGLGLPDYLDTHPDAAELFDGAMADMSVFLNRAVLGAYDFSAAHAVTDVGGGHSTLLADILRANPAVRGTLIDRTRIADRVQRELEADGLEGRCQVIAGDIAGDVPAGADVYLLNRVLHDWDDECALAILEACAHAMAPDSKLLIIEQLLEQGQPSKRTAFLDLQMLVLRGGGERTAAQYEQLLSQAGLSLDQVIGTYSPMTIVQARLA